ncbi:hypothetical protein [Halarcobacter sp.]|uniref:hypothetical protein n=1 Tax=Halarcobacter sp. TaxID=2321133 RepID=UPI002AA89192|nr:hypothetical protein [Halarcobacter sp.]
MVFENDYNAFMRSIYLNDAIGGEKIISASDTKNNFIVDAINDFGELRVKTFMRDFKSSGLKISLSKYLDI